MARAAGGTVHVGKAAAIIVVGLLLGIIVLNSDGSGASVSDSNAAARAVAALQKSLTPTTVRRSGTKSTTTTTAALRTPASIKVIAINGTKTAGVGGQATTKLRNATYNVLAPGNATAAVRAANPVSVVYVVTPGYEPEAVAVAALLGLPPTSVKALPTPSPSTDIKPGVNIAVLVGSGFTP